MKKRKNTPLVIITLLLLIITSTTSYAYVTWGGGYISKSIPIEDRAIDYPTTASFNAWNNCGAGVNIYRVPGTGNNWIISMQVADTYAGLYTVITREYLLFGRATKFRIIINVSVCVNLSNFVKQAVIVHELGHALCLYDNPPEYPAIMRYDCVQTWNTPQQDDINGVLVSY